MPSYTSLIKLELEDKANAAVYWFWISSGVLFEVLSPSDVDAGVYSVL